MEKAWERSGGWEATLEGRGDVEGLGKLGGLEEKQPREHTTSGNVDHPVLTAGGFSRAEFTEKEWWSAHCMGRSWHYK